jgi:hypothetical protein
MHSLSTTIMALLFAAGQTQAWSAAFYNSQTSCCGKDTAPDTYVTYDGTDQGDCILIGNPGDECKYIFNGGANCKQRRLYGSITKPVDFGSDGRQYRVRLLRR